MLRVEGLIRRAGRFTLAIDEMTIPEGHYYVVVGPSGAGKTMLLETIAGHHTPDAGRIYIGDRDVTTAPPRERHIGFLYQQFWLFPHMTVRQNIQFGLKYHKPTDRTPDQIAVELAEVLRVSDLLDRLPRNLSGGEQQRVALARALAIRPAVLFLDEPLGTLDPLTREVVAAELKAWHDRFGTTTMHVTHDHAEARIMSDGVAVISDGQLAQAGPVADVFDKPATPELARFLGCENVLEGTVVSTNGQRCTVEVGGLRFSAPAVSQTGPIVACLRPENVAIVTEKAGTNGDNFVKGRLTEAVDRGAHLRAVVDVDGTPVVLNTTRATLRTVGVVVGDPVHLTFAPEAVHLLPPASRRPKKRVIELAPLDSEHPL